MKYLLLWLEAPLQSWGNDSRFDFRKTMDFPSKSGLYGLLLASSGDSGPQEDLLARMAEAPLSFVTFQDDSHRIRDFHMVGNGYDKGDPWERMLIPHTPDNTIAVGGGAKLTYREYLQNKAFAAILALSDDLADKFAKALQSPVYDLYLGRKCCVPTDMIFRGSYSSMKEALTTLQKLAEEKKKTLVSVIADASPQEVEANADNLMLNNDIPVRFGQHKLYRDRWVVEKAWGSFLQEGGY